MQVPGFCERTVTFSPSVLSWTIQGTALVPVPNVVGVTQVLATTAITNAGLVVGAVTQQSSASVPAGNVISQAPPAGSSVATGSAVDLVVSTGAANAALPGNPSNPASTAIQDLVAAPLVADSEIVTDANLGPIARNRLQIRILSTTTIGQVNAAIASVNGEIVSMLEGFSGIEIRFPDPLTLSALEQIAASLAAMPGIVAAEKVRVGDLLEPNELPSNVGLPLDDKLADLAAARAPGVWNTRGLLVARGAVAAANGDLRRFHGNGSRWRRNLFSPARRCRCAAPAGAG